jgi:predicted dehydrogenase
MQDDMFGRVGIFGLGLIGKKRYQAICKLGLADKTFVFDPNISKQDLQSGSSIVKCEDDLLSLRLENYFVCVPHSSAASIVSRLNQKSSNVLIEKPLGSSLREALEIESSALSNNLRVGFNYRFMRGVRDLKEIIANGELGHILSIEMEIGHGGSPGDENSWKLNPKIAGGGAILDPGVHLLDLLGFIFSISSRDIEIYGMTTTSGFWNTGIEEVAQIVAKSGDVSISLSISLVSWKTRFNVRVTGKEGYVELSGRGRSDGPQILKKGKRWGWMSGVSQLDSEVSQIVMQEDNSFEIETEAFLSMNGDVATASDGVDVMKTYEKILRYRRL